MPPEQRPSDETGLQSLSSSLEVLFKDIQEEEARCLDSLAEELQKLPKITIEKPPPKTFMEIAGYKETTFSNLLAFYLNTEEEHGLKDLLIKSLLACVDGEEPWSDQQFSSQEVFTEYKAEGKRIDIVATYHLNGYNKGLVLGIENKLWSALRNDLAAYAKAIEELANEESQIVKILLAPDKKDAWAGFRSVTYQELFEKVKHRLTDHIHLPSKYITYLADMFYTLCKPPINHMESIKKYQSFIKFIKTPGNREHFERAKEMEQGLHEAMNQCLEDFYNKLDLEANEKAQAVNQKLAQHGLKLSTQFYPENKNHLSQRSLVYDSCLKDDEGKSRLDAKYRGYMLFTEVCKYPGDSQGFYARLGGASDCPLQVREELIESVATVRDGLFPYDQLKEANDRALEVFLRTLQLIDEEIDQEIDQP